MRILPILSITLLSCLTSHAETWSALAASHALPDGIASQVARVEGQEGRPDPDRWYFLAFDPAAENGFREFVVAKGRLIAIREISQFVERLDAQDVIGIDGLETDSTQVAEQAREYAAANDRSIGSFNYELRATGDGSKPSWVVHCIGSQGAEFGRLEVAANTGAVTRHDGFASVPARSEPHAGRTFFTPDPGGTEDRPPVPARSPMAAEDGLQKSVTENAAAPQFRRTSSFDDHGRYGFHYRGAYRADDNSPTVLGTRKRSYSPDPTAANREYSAPPYWSRRNAFDGRYDSGERLRDPEDESAPSDGAIPERHHGALHRWFERVLPF